VNGQDLQMRTTAIMSCVLLLDSGRRRARRDPFNSPLMIPPASTFSYFQQSEKRTKLRRWRSLARATNCPFS
jgi:hypothetical protein